MTAPAITSSSAGSREALAVEVWHAGKRISQAPLRVERLTIGRDRQQDVQLDSPAVSRRHAEIIRDPFGRVWICDLGSRNGVRVNNARVNTQVLRLGDSVTIGEYLLRLVDLAPRGDSTVHIPADVSDGGIITRMLSLSEVAEPRLSAPHLSAIMDLSAALAQQADAAARLEALCNLVAGDLFQGRFVAALRVPHDQPQRPLSLRPPVIHPQWEQRVPRLSRSVLAAALERDEPFMAANTDLGSADLRLSITPDQQPMSVIACPIVRGDEFVDLLYVGLPPHYATPEWLVLLSLAVRQYRQAESAWAARADAERQAVIERELEHARRIQRSFLPSPRPLPGIDFVVDFRPSLWVGGDYADVIPRAGGQVLLIVGDVAGKGLQAALIAASLHAIMHVLSDCEPDLRTLVSRLNEYLCANLTGGSFVTAVFVQLDPRTGDVRCINAGHPPALAVGPDGAVAPLQSRAHMPLGLDSSAFEVQPTTLPPGHWLALYSDGFTELRGESDDLLGTARLGEYLAAIARDPAAASASAVAARLHERLAAFARCALASDDQTLIVARRTPSNTPEPAEYHV